MLPFHLQVRVLVPDAKGGRIEVAVLGRGQFVGERSVINDKLRSADCVAQGKVQVVVLKKRDFLDLDNPLLAWMLDYDAVSAVLKSLPAFKKLKQEQMEHIFDRFEARQELYQGDTILQHGDMVSCFATDQSSCWLSSVCLQQVSSKNILVTTVLLLSSGYNWPVLHCMACLWLVLTLISIAVVLLPADCFV